VWSLHNGHSATDSAVLDTAEEPQLKRKGKLVTIGAPHTNKKRRAETLGNSNNSVASVAKGPKFRPQNEKGALQKYARLDKIAAELSLYLPKKKAEKGPNFPEYYYSCKNA
jgi:hypothetical protein